MKKLRAGGLVVLSAVFLWAAGNASAADLSKVNFNGYLDMEFSSADNPEGNYNGSFHQHHLSFLLDVPVSDKLSALTHIEFDHGTNINSTNVGTTTKTSQGGGDIIVENAFIRYNRSDEVQLRFGRMLTPFGYYNEIHDATPAIISIFVPKAVNNLEERGGTQMFPKWNTGINVLGTIITGVGIVDYSAYVGNGENPANAGYNESQVDANTNKAVGARVNVQPYEGLVVGGNIFYDEAAFVTSSGTLTGKPHATAGLMLAINGRNLFFLSEFAQSWLQGARSSAGYGQLTYFVSKRFSPYYRYEYASPDETATDNLWIEQIGGLNIRPFEEENLILKIEYSHNSRGRNNVAIINSPIFQELRVAVALFF